MQKRGHRHWLWTPWPCNGSSMRKTRFGVHGFHGSQRHRKTVFKRAVDEAARSSGINHFLCSLPNMCVEKKQLVMDDLWMHRLKQLMEGSEMQHRMRFGVGWGIWKINTI